jgi:hypothetical protein
VRLVATYDKPAPQAMGKVRGRVLDEAHRIRGQLSVSLQTDRGSLNGRIEGESFAFDHVAPGEYRVQAFSGDNPVYLGPVFTIAPGADIDLGPLITEPGGALLLRLERAADTADLILDVRLSRDEGGSGRTISFGPGGTGRRIDNLQPGNYRLTAYGFDIAFGCETSCVIAPGVDASAVIRLRAGVQRDIVVDFAAEQPVQGIRVVEDGRTIWALSNNHVAPRPWKLELRLPLGSFVVRAETSTGRAVEMPFTMTSLDHAQPPVRLDLR